MHQIGETAKKNVGLNCWWGYGERAGGNGKSYIASLESSLMTSIKISVLAFA